jgi:hypothetical protein
MEMIREEHFGARIRLDRFLDLNADYSAHSRPRELKLVSLEAPGKEDFLAYLQMKRQCKSFDQFINSLCDNINGR